jgi:ribose 1,5-bisphosphokinase PhnN
LITATLISRGREDKEKLLKKLIIPERQTVVEALVSSLEISSTGCRTGATLICKERRNQRKERL